MLKKMKQTNLVATVTDNTYFYTKPSPLAFEKSKPKN